MVVTVLEPASQPETVADQLEATLDQLRALDPALAREWEGFLGRALDLAEWELNQLQYGPLASQRQALPPLPHSLLGEWHAEQQRVRGETIAHGYRERVRSSGIETRVIVNAESLTNLPAGLSMSALARAAAARTGMSAASVRVMLQRAKVGKATLSTDLADAVEAVLVERGVTTS
jgi:hypothetical protein